MVKEDKVIYVYDDFTGDKNINKKNIRLNNRRMFFSPFFRPFLYIERIDFSFRKWIVCGITLPDYAL